MQNVQARINSFFKLKKMAKKYKNEINLYTTKNKFIRGGKRILTGTRITTKELMLMVDEANGRNIFDYILSNYPSINSKNQILCGVLYEVRHTNAFKFILEAIITSYIDGK